MSSTQMIEYAVLIPGDEDAWAQATDADRQAVYEQHAEFARLLAERGHEVRGGAELTRSSTARTLRAGPEGVSISEGPYAESAEQLTGFYLVASSDLDDLLDVCRVLVGAEGTIEVRATVDHSGGGQ